MVVRLNKIYQPDTKIISGEVLGGFFIWCLANEFCLKTNLFGARGAQGLFGGLGLASTESYSEEQGRL